MTTHDQEPPEATIRVLAAVVLDGARLLLAQRPLDKRHGGLWEFPGGKREEGEDDEAAIRRELAEELGVTARQVGAPVATHRDPGSRYLIVFVPVHIEGTPQALEHSAVGWFTPSEARALPLAPSDAAFLGQWPMALERRTGRR